MRLGELGLTIVAGLMSYIVVVAPVAGLTILPLLSIPLVATLLVIVMQSLGCYRVSALRAPTRFGLRISVAWFAVFGATFAACWLADTNALFDKAWLGHWTFFGFLAISTERFGLALVTNYLTRTGKLSRRTVIVGGGPPAKQLLQEFAEEGSEDLHVFGIFDDRTDERSPDVVAGFPKLGNVDDLVAFARHTPLDLVIFTLADLGRAAPARDAAQAVGAARRHPPRRAHEQAEVPPARLFLHRQGAGDRLVRQAARRVGHRRQVDLRPARRRVLPASRSPPSWRWSRSP